MTRMGCRRAGFLNVADPWRVLDFSDFQGQIRSTKGGIIVQNETSVRTVPVADVAVVLIGVNTLFSSGVIHRLAGYGTAVIFCNWRRIPIASTYPWSIHTRVGARQKAQANLNLPRQKHAWQQLVKAKVHGQAANLTTQNPSAAARLQQLAESVRSGDPENIEAQAARITWKALAGENFQRMPGDGTGANALFDYGYTVLRGHIIREVVAAGLNPALGVFHRGRNNLFALADDLIEPFRPAVDSVVQTIGIEADIDQRKVKQQLVGVVNLRMSRRTETIATTITNLAREYGMYVEGSRQRLKVPAWGGACRG